MIKQIFIFLFLVFGLQQCKAQIELPENLNGMLLYIEDLDGVGGNASGNFSDIVAFDPLNKLQYVLTSDNFYDQRPTYSRKTNKVYFESKREKYHPSVGLTAPTHIYELDLPSTNITLIDNETFRNKMELKKHKEINIPAVNESGNKLLFQFLWGNYKNNYDRLVQYDLNINSYEFLFDSLYTSLRYIFEENGASIVVQNHISDDWKDRTNYIAKLDIETKSITKYVQEKNIENNLGDVKYDKIVFVTRDFNHSDIISDLFIYDIKSDKKDKISSVKELGFREIKYPVFKSENFIYFIGSKESTNPDTFDEDIYLLNLNTKEMKQITFTRNIKDNLRYYE